jgi:hypothetical protein
MNSSVEHTLRLKDSFSKVDDPKGHLKKMLSTTLLNGFRKNGVPNHELILKVGNICLVTCAINGLGLANNSRVCIIAIHRYCVEVLTVGWHTHFIQIQITIWKVISAYKITIPIASSLCHDMQQKSISNTVQSASRHHFTSL